MDLEEIRRKAKKAPRSKLLTMPIRARSADSKVDRTFEDYVLEVEKERVYIKTTDPLPVGTRLHFALDLPGEDRPLYLQGEVVRINLSRPSGDDGLEPGMGIVFDHIRYDDRNKINEFLDKIESESTGEEYSTFLTWINKISQPMTQAERERVKKDLLKAIYGKAKAKAEAEEHPAPGARSQELGVLAGIPLFEGLEDLDLEEISRIAKREAFQPDDTIFREGDQGDKLFIILEGRVKIVKLVPAKGSQTLVTLKPGDYFGEMALVDEAPRSAGAVADGPATLLVIENQDLKALLENSNAIAAKLYKFFVKTLNQRLRDTNEKIKQFISLAGGGSL